MGIRNIDANCQETETIMNLDEISYSAYLQMARVWFYIIKDYQIAEKYSTIALRYKSNCGEAKFIQFWSKQKLSIINN